MTITPDEPVPTPPEEDPVESGEPIEMPPAAEPDEGEDSGSAAADQ